MLTKTEETMINLSVSGKVFGGALQHPLAYAGTLWHRVVINQETVDRVANDLGFDWQPCLGIVRILRACNRVPTDERLAVILQLDPGFEDADVAEVFDRSVEWARAVRRDADAIRMAEPFDLELEWYDPGFQKNDPDPEEIYRRALLERTVSGTTRRVASGVRKFAWRFRGLSSILVSVN